MKSIKRLIIPLALLIILFSGSCKKVPFYGISDGMKEYFSYKPGSYWIYKNDSTGSFDSTYVYSYHDYNFKNTQGINIELLNINFKSQFLAEFDIYYVSCQGPDYFVVGHVDPTLPPGGGGLAFYPGWPSNTKVVPNCGPGDIFFYKTLTKDTINNNIYNNVLYTELQSTDSSSTSEYYYIRKLHFEKNIGIVKYFEIDRYNNIRNAYSLVRYKVIQ